MSKHEFYNTDHYPHYVMTEGNFTIWANGNGFCASIPTSKAQRAGCRSTHFGDLFYVSMVKGVKLYKR